MQATVVFRKAEQSGNTCTMGAAMTAAEVGQAVASVSLVMDGYYIGTNYPPYGRPMAAATTASESTH
jgi:hypothetical protein